MRPSMRGLARQRDAERFCGRVRELGLLDRVLDDDGIASVVLVHGPGGVGKSTLLREVVRRARARGYTAVTVDGREPGAGALEPALATLTVAARPLLAIDTYERIAALGAHLRGEVVARLPATARLLIAGRTPPEAGWSQDGWDAVTLELPLATLEPDDAAQLLARRGITDAATIAELTAWARGLPLALAVGADAALARVAGAQRHVVTVKGGSSRVGGIPTPLTRLELGGEERLDTDARLAATLLRRLAGDELEGADRDVLGVAAIATAVDARLLGAVLPGVDGDHAETWLRGLSFAERHGTRVTLHERVRAALRRDLVERDPDHERELRRAVADHLHDRALLGEPRLVAELAALIDDPAVRWGFAAATDRYRIDRVRPQDADTAQARPWVRRYILDAPDRVGAVRGATGRLAGLCVAVTPATAPAFSAEDPVLGPWLDHARAHHPDGNVLLYRDTIDLTAGDADVVALLNTAANLVCGLPNVRCFYGAADPDDANARRLSEAIGAVHRPELDATDGARRVQCHVLDHGPGGLVGTARALVYRDLGLHPPAPSAGADAIRDALRAFHDPIALAASPLARGATTAARAGSVRSLLTGAVAAAFGESADEQLQRATVQRGYLDADGGHARAALELNLSRTTYFRRLSAATARIAAYLLAQRV